MPPILTRMLVKLYVPFAAQRAIRGMALRRCCHHLRSWIFPEVYLLILDPSSSFLTNAVLRLYHLGGQQAHRHYIAARERSAALLGQRKYEAMLESARNDSAAEIAKVRLQALPGDIARNEASAARHRQILINTVLTLRCPHCQLAMLDFDGCFAVQHKPGGCNKEFCGWCLLPFPDTGACHEHVKNCPSRLFTNPFHKYIESK